MKPIEKIFCIFLAAAAVFGASPAAGDIVTRTIASWEVDPAGNIVVSVDICNDGAETAYALAAALFIGKQELFETGLGDNPGGEKVRATFTVDGARLKPGTYIAMVRLGFEEQNGQRHHTLHPVPFEIPRAAAPASLPIETTLTDVVFNPKAFWKKTGEIGVTLKNKGGTPLQARLAAWYPDGFSIRPDVARAALDPGSEKTLYLSAALTGAHRSADYYLVVDAETERRHHALLVRGDLSVQPRPIYFKIYLILAAAGALALAAWIALRLRRK